MSISLALIGHGKMGRAVEQVARERGHRIAAVLGRAEMRDLKRSALDGADVAVEFTAPDAALPNAIACLRNGLPVVVGTTGWFAQLSELERAVAESKGALLWAPNFSIGVQILSHLVELLASLHPSRHGFESHMVETHHAAKKDAPSGTAEMLAGIYSQAGGGPLRISSVRVGYVPGRHELLLDARHEQIRLVHDARDRRVFADGAVTAAEWLVREPRQGIFTLRDVLRDDSGAAR